MCSIVWLHMTAQAIDLQAACTYIHGADLSTLGEASVRHQFVMSAQSRVG